MCVHYKMKNSINNFWCLIYLHTYCQGQIMSPTHPLLEGYQEPACFLFREAARNRTLVGCMEVRLTDPSTTDGKGNRDTGKCCEVQVLLGSVHQSAGHQYLSMKPEGFRSLHQNIN